MNTMPVSKAARRVAWSLPLMPRRDLGNNEFLAPALEILETPPSPVRMSMIVVICALVLAMIAWAYIGQIDMVATAQGKIQPLGRVKIVEPLETGKIVKINAMNGSHVNEGETLVELEAAAAEAEILSAEQSLASAEAESTRRRAALAVARNRSFNPLPSIVWDENVPESLRERENKIYIADLSQLQTAVSVLEAQRSQKQAERDQLAETMASQKNLIATLQQRVDMRNRLIELNAGTRLSLIDATETLQYQITQLALQKGQAVSVEKGIAVYSEQETKAFNDFISDNAQKLSDSERHSEEFRQTLAKAVATRDHLTLKAPIDGVVQASIATNAGQVLMSGQETMRIVPEGGNLEAEIYLQNRDIGMVKVGQEAIVKIDAFPFTRFGVIHGYVTHVAEDAIPELDAGQIEGDPTRSAKSIGYAGAQRTQNLVFPVRLRLDANSVNVDGHMVALTSGMTITADLRTGRRRVLEYLFSPMIEVSSQAMREH